MTNPFPTKMKYFRDLLTSGYSIVLIFDVIAKVLMAVATIFIIRVLTQEDYAIYTIFQSISSLVLSILGTGLTVAYVRFAAERISRGEPNSKGLFDLCCVLITILGIVSLLIVQPLGKLYGISIFCGILSLLYGMTLSLNKMTQSYFQTEELYRESGIATNFKNVLLCITIIAIYFFFKKLDANQIMVVTLISSLLAFGLGYVWIVKRSKKNLEQAIPLVLFKNLLKESGSLLLYFFLVALFDQMCIVIMSNISTESDIANYGVASKYYFLALTFLTSIGTVLRVKTSNKEMIDDVSMRKKFVCNWIKKVWIIATLACATAILSAGYVLPFLNGDGYSDSIPAFRILMVGVFISYVFAPNVAVMMAAKKNNLLCILALASAVINAILCLLLVPSIGASGAAISVVCSNALLNISCSVIILRSH